MEYRSHLGVYAVATDGAGRMLLIKKGLGCYTGLYDLPGGGLEAHELPEEALAREVLEETSCTVAHAAQAGTWGVLYPFEDIVLRHIGIIYRVKITGTPRAEAGEDDSLGCVWIKPEDITEENAAPFVVRAARELL
jgi:ADP-ribose pyrophosphatase YjhB (NUDIX family)